MAASNEVSLPKSTPEFHEVLSKTDPAETPALLRVLAKSLAAMRAYVGAENALAAGQLTERQRIQIALAVAEINGSRSCLAAHSRRARSLHLNDDDIHLARRAMSTDGREGAMLRFTQTVVLQRGVIKDENLRVVREAGFSESEIIEIVANIALNIFTNYLSLLPNAGVNDPLPSESCAPLASAQPGQEL